MDYILTEQETYTLSEVQAIVKELKDKCDDIILEKDIQIEEMNAQITELGDIKAQNHAINVDMLLKEYGLDSTLKPLVDDEDIEVVKTKVELLSKLVTKEDIEEVEEEEIQEDVEKVEEDEDEIVEEEEEKKVDTYVPTKNRTEDQYNKAIDKKNVKSALKTKLRKAY